MSEVLDTLKATVLRVDDLISLAQDTIAGAVRDADYEIDSDLEILDSARRELWEALATHIPGVRYELPHFTDAGGRAARTYSDGTAVVESIELRNGSIASFYPRYDGDRNEFIEKMTANGRPHLSIVERQPD
jgi:hypothetical protein